eukprot:gb/GECH01011941.1/.p1 GENE.gb/GECH01011941.1/~~gb/GECH01011941.1/.p1  ORF type:complete len:543 (+),score=157.34 gb/GECH01011941.1/:1-1629(+)
MSQENISENSTNQDDKNRESLERDLSVLCPSGVTPELKEKIDQVPVETIRKLITVFATHLVTDDSAEVKYIVLRSFLPQLGLALRGFPWTREQIEEKLEHITGREIQNVPFNKRKRLRFNFEEFLSICLQIAIDGFEQNRDGKSLKSVTNFSNDLVEQMRKIFKSIDVDDSEDITWNELVEYVEQYQKGDKSFAKRVLAQLDKTELKELMRDIDVDGDGKLDFNEFLITLGILMRQSVTAEENIQDRARRQGIDRIMSAYEHLETAIEEIYNANNASIGSETVKNQEKKTKKILSLRKILERKRIELLIPRASKETMETYRTFFTKKDLIDNILLFHVVAEKQGHGKIEDASARKTITIEDVKKRVLPKIALGLGGSPWNRDEIDDKLDELVGFHDPEDKVNLTQFISILTGYLLNFAKEGISQRGRKWAEENLMNSPEKKAAMKRKFRTIDQDNSGSIDIQEMKAYIKQNISINLRDKGIQKMFDMIDVDDSGTVDFPEFLTFMALIYQPNENQDEKEKSKEEEAKASLTRSVNMVRKTLI